jgi:hypothetical protein
MGNASGAVLVLLGFLFLVGCGTTGAAERGVSSEPEGPVVASGSIAGRTWRLSVDRRDDGSICSWLEYGPGGAHSAISFSCSAGGVEGSGSDSRLQVEEPTSIETGARVPDGQLLVFITGPSVASLRLAIELPNRTVKRRSVTVRPVEEGVAESAGFDEAFGVATVLVKHAPYHPCIRRTTALGTDGKVLERSPRRGCGRNYFAQN